MTDLQQKGVLGPGKKINTDYLFHVKIAFEQSSYTLTLTQGNHVDVSTVNNEYIEGMAASLDGNMAFVLSSWMNDEISWLQHGAC